MATRQYIGARYVPKFYDFNGSPEWRSGTAYESLTIVTRNGNSYTSKIPVPSSVGAPENNPQYWVSTGVYNEQIEAYRQLTEKVAARVEEVNTDLTNDISDEATTRGNADTALGDRIDAEATARANADTALGDRIDEINSVKKWVMLSDSYGSAAGNESGVNTTIFDILRTITNRTNDNLVGWAIPGGGFMAPDSGSFNNYVRNHYSEVTDRESVEKFIVVAGRNDWVASRTTILSYISTFVQTVKEYFPNAKIYFGYIANGTNSGHGTRAQQMEVYFAYTSVEKLGCIYLNGCENILNNNTLLASDLVHPTLEGKHALAYGIFNAIETGYCTSSSVGYQALTSHAGTAFYTQAPVMNGSVYNDTAQFQIPRQLAFNLSTATAFTRNEEHEIVFADIAQNTGTLLAPYGSLYFTCTIVFNDGGKYVTEPGLVKITSDMTMSLVFTPSVALTSVTFVVIKSPGLCNAVTVAVR